MNTDGFFVVLDGVFSVLTIRVLIDTDACKLCPVGCIIQKSEEDGNDGAGGFIARPRIVTGSMQQITEQIKTLAQRTCSQIISQSFGVK